MSTLILRKSVKVKALVETEKIVSEYSNNRSRLIGKTELFVQIRTRPVPSLANFYCFNIHALISRLKAGFPRQLRAHFKGRGHANITGKFQS